MLSGYLVNSVEGGVSWVELDLGQDSVSGWGSSGNSNWGSSSKRSGNWSSNGWGSGVGESWGSDGWSSGIGDDWGGGDLGLNCGWGLIKSSLEFSLGSSNLWGILNGNWDWEVKD